MSDGDTVDAPVTYRMYRYDRRGRKKPGPPIVVRSLGEAMDLVSSGTEDEMYDFDHDSPVPWIGINGNMAVSRSTPGSRAAVDFAQMMRAGVKFTGPSSAREYIDISSMEQEERLARWRDDQAWTSALIGVAGLPGEWYLRGRGYGEQIDDIREAHPGSYIAGAIGSTALETIATAGLSSLASGGRIAAGLARVAEAGGSIAARRGMAASALGRVLAKAGETPASAAARYASMPAIQRIIRGGVEGGVIGAGYSVADHVVRDRDLAASQIAADGGLVMLLGAAIPAIGPGLRATRRAFSRTPGSRVLGAGREGRTVISGDMSSEAVADIIHAQRDTASIGRMTTGSRGRDFAARGSARLARMGGARIAPDEAAILNASVVRELSEESMKEITARSTRATTENLNVAKSVFDDIDKGIRGPNRALDYPMEFFGEAPFEVAQHSVFSSMRAARQRIGYILNPTTNPAARLVPDAERIALGAVSQEARTVMDMASDLANYSAISRALSKGQINMRAMKGIGIDVDSIMARGPDADSVVTALKEAAVVAVSRESLASKVRELYAHATAVNKKAIDAANAVKSVAGRDAANEAVDVIRASLLDRRVWGQVASIETERHQLYRDFLGTLNTLQKKPQGKFTVGRSAVQMMKDNRFNEESVDGVIRSTSEATGANNYPFVMKQLKELEEISNTRFNRLSELMWDKDLAAEMRDRQNKLMSALKKAREAFSTGRNEATIRKWVSDRGLLKQDFAGRSRAYLAGRGLIWPVAGAVLGGPSSVGSVAGVGAGLLASKAYGWASSPLRVMKTFGDSARVFTNSEARIAAGTAAIKSSIDAAAGMRPSKNIRYSAFVGISAFRNLDDREKTREDYEAIVKRLRDIAENQETALDEISSMTMGADYVSPELSSALRAKLTTMVSYATTFMPRMISDPLRPGKFISPSLGEMDSFIRRMSALQDPYSLPFLAAQNKLSHEAVHAVQNVFSEIYARQVEGALNVVVDKAERGENIPYQTRLQLGMFFGIPDQYTEPQFLLAMNSNYSQTAGQTQALAPSQARPVSVFSQQETTTLQTLQGK